MQYQSFNPVRIGANLVKHRYIIGQLTIRDVLLKYKGSYLGISWSFIHPLLMLSVFSIVFGHIFSSRWPQLASPAPFALIMYCGLVVFSIFSEVASRAPGLILGYPSYVKKIIFPLETIPAMLVASAFIHGAINLSILLVAVAVFANLHWSVLWIPVVLLPLVFFAFGLAWLLSAAGIFVRDLVNIMPIFVQIVMFLSPVFYPITAVPRYLKWLYQINPLSAVIEDLRRVALWGEMPNWENWSITLAACTAIAILGYALFVRAKEEFADVL